MKTDIKIENVTVSYRENIALRNITLEIPEKTFVSVIGPNGAGKTTLLTVINGLGKIIQGSVKIGDEKLTSRNINDIRKIIGYVPQHIGVDARFPATVKDIVKIGRYGKIKNFIKWSFEDENAVIRAMETTGIIHLSSRPIGHLSGGEFQKVSIARALAQEPEILLLDEPTSSLDPRSQNEIIKLIEKIYEEKKITTIFVTHILSHIPDKCSMVILMKNARIYFSGSVNDGLKQELLSELYDICVQVNLINGKRHFHIEGTHHYD